MKKIVLLILMVAMALTALSADESKVLIIKEDTGYKKALVKALVEKLEEANAEVTVLDHRKGSIEDVDPSTYDAVFITNSGVQAKVRPVVSTWLKSVSGRDDNVIVHTTQTGDWSPDVDVDSITSASKRNNIGPLVEEIFQKINKFSNK